MKDPFQTVDEYIDSFAGERRERLIELRSMIREAAPDAEEKLSWGVPTYYLNGFLVEFAMARAHIGLHTSPEAIAHFAEELEGYQTKHGHTTQLPLNRELPADLIRRMVRFCAERNQDKES